jgi:hypothetical protein
MFHVALSTEEIRLITVAPEAPYQAARWIRQFHGAQYSHIGFQDHFPDTPLHDVLDKHGFIRVPRFELNAIRQLLQTYGPILLKGAYSHVAQNEATVPAPGISLTRVTVYEAADHAVLINGYWDGFEPQLLFRDPAHPQRQFVDSAPGLLARQAVDAGIFYMNCAAFPKPCVHVTRNSPLVLVPAIKRQRPEPEPDAEE